MADKETGEVQEFKLSGVLEGIGVVRSFKTKAGKDFQLLNLTVCTKLEDMDGCLVSASVKVGVKPEDIRGLKTGQNVSILYRLFSDAGKYQQLAATAYAVVAR